MADNTELASKFTVAAYKQAVARQDGATISDAIRRRFRERYIAPLTSTSRHGFPMMAAACLMIEALESFRQGWTRTDKNGRSPETFRLFFEASELFEPFRGRDFYKHIRCGILHQAETTGGWRIRRTGPILEPTTMTVNAARFVRALSTALDEFCADLEATPWDDPKWQRVRHKMDAVVRHCKITP